MKAAPTLDAELTIYTVAETRRALAAWLEGGEGGTLDLTVVTEVDTVGLQLLVWARAEAARLGKPLAFTSPSPALGALETLFGLAGEGGTP